MSSHTTDTELNERVLKYPSNTILSTNQQEKWTIEYKYTKLPETFDGRKQWAGLKDKIYQQGSCGSCWAFATCEMFADRYYILTGGKVNVQLSPVTLLLCSQDGGINPQFAYKGEMEANSGANTPNTLNNLQNSKDVKQRECFGNTIENALIYLLLFGACTIECVPYAFDFASQFPKKFSQVYANLPHDTRQQLDIGMSDHSLFNKPISSLDYVSAGQGGGGVGAGTAPWKKYDFTNFKSDAILPTCGQLMSSNADMCTNYNRGANAADGLQGTPSRFYRISMYYDVVRETLAKTNEAIRQDIFKWGPVVSVMELYSDFYIGDAKTGIYKWNGKGSPVAAHAIEIIGWGTEIDPVLGKADYWIVKNSWGKEWGDDGCFKIVRGVNECKIEENVMAALPDFFSPTLTVGFMVPGMAPDVTFKKKKPNKQYKNFFNVTMTTNAKRWIDGTYGVKQSQTVSTNEPSEYPFGGKEIHQGDYLRAASISAWMRTSMDFGMYRPTYWMDKLLQIKPNFDFIHNFSGGIVPETGITRRAMLINTGLDFTPPIKITDVSFPPNFHAGAVKIKQYREKQPIFISDYIFILMSSLATVVLFFSIILKFKKQTI